MTASSIEHSYVTFDALERRAERLREQWQRDIQQNETERRIQAIKRSTRRLQIGYSVVIGLGYLVLMLVIAYRLGAENAGS